MYFALSIANDFSERVHYNYPNLPLYARRTKLHDHKKYLFSAATSHWHEDIELAVVVNGRMGYNINGKSIVINEGEGIFVNSRQLHYAHSINGEDCDFICIIIHPSLFCTSELIKETYLSPLINNLSFKSQKLIPSLDWQADLLQEISSIFYQIDTGEKAKIISVQASLFKLLSSLYENMPKQLEESISPKDKLSSLTEMIGYIQKNYAEKLSLSDISTAGFTCQSNCYAMFHDYFKQTPIAYLTSYRLNKAAELLENTDIKITDIALKTGFNGSSYFCEAFKKQFRCTPGEYRKRNGRLAS
jgi:AraC-like DNA-binding protein